MGTQSQRLPTLACVLVVGCQALPPLYLSHNHQHTPRGRWARTIPPTSTGDRPGASGVGRGGGEEGKGRRGGQASATLRPVRRTWPHVTLGHTGWHQVAAPTSIRPGSASPPPANAQFRDRSPGAVRQTEMLCPTLCGKMRGYNNDRNSERSTTGIGAGGGVFTMPATNHRHGTGWGSGGSNVRVHRPLAQPGRTFTGSNQHPPPAGPSAPPHVRSTAHTGVPCRCTVAVVPSNQTSGRNGGTTPNR